MSRCLVPSLTIWGQSKSLSVGVQHLLVLGAALAASSKLSGEVARIRWRNTPKIAREVREGVQKSRKQ